VKISIPRAKVKTDSHEYQAIIKAAPPVKRGSRTRSHHAAHEFRWTETKDGGTGWCTCAYWTLWGDSLESAKQSHGYHRSNLLEPSAKDTMEVEDAT